MCEPTTILAASMAISAASATLQYQQQRKQAAAQEKAVQYGNALETAALHRQYEEQGAVAQEQMGERAVQHLQDLGRLRAIAADMGNAGNTQDRVMSAEANAYGKDIVTITTNARRASEQSHAQGMSAQAEADTMLSNIKRPSALGLGLQIAGTAAQAYGAYSSQQAALEAAKKPPTVKP